MMVSDVDFRAPFGGAPTPDYTAAARGADAARPLDRAAGSFEADAPSSLELIVEGQGFVAEIRIESDQNALCMAVTASFAGQPLAGLPIRIDSPGEGTTEAHTGPGGSYLVGPLRVTDEPIELTIGMGADARTFRF